MGKITFSVITTVYNEERSMEKLLRSLENQTVPADEVVVVDAGSSDRTVSVVREWQKAHPTKRYLLFEQPGVNRSVGRNIAIKRARNDYVAVIDAGCSADPRWLERFRHAFTSDQRIETVAGFYRVKPRSRKERCFAPYLAVMPDAFDSETYLPSSRSMAMTRAAWKKVGGYPEHLSTCEDLVLAAALKQQTIMVVEPKADVLWELPPTFKEYFMRVRGYARGDVEARYQPHLWTIITVFGRYALFAWWWPLFGLYLLYVTVKHFRETVKGGSFWLVPATQVVTDMAIMTGALEGLAKFGKDGVQGIRQRDQSRD